MNIIVLRQVFWLWDRAESLWEIGNTVYVNCLPLP